MAQYPSAPAAFTVKQSGDTIEAQHINNLQDEVIVLTDNLLTGLAHSVIPAATNLYDLGNPGRKWRHLQLAGNATIGGAISAGGPVTAPGFIGSGAGLIGVPVQGVLDDLTDVNTPAPANGEVLTYDFATLKWIAKPITLPGGGVANLNDLLDVTLTGPVEGQMLVFRSGLWVNETVATGGGGDTTPPGLIAPYAGAAAPAGYLLCDGAPASRTTFAALFAVIGTTYGPGDNSTTFNVPNLQRRFPLGKSASGEAATLGEVLGLWNHTHTTPAHQHGVGSLTVASHSHSAGSMAVENHTHPAGGLVAASHTHGAGSLVSADHQHSFGVTIDPAGGHSHIVTGFTDSGGNHNHQVNVGQGADSGSSFNAVRTTTNTSDHLGHQHGMTLNSTAVGDHSHTGGGLTAGIGALPIGGATAAAGAGVTGATGATAPALTGNTGAAAPGVTGTTAIDGASTTGSANPPSLVLNYIIKT